MTAAEVDQPGSARWWVEHGERLQRRRPRSGGLTVERVVSAAIDLIDSEGLDVLTVRSLASRLDTSSATLYRHVASVEELHVLVADRIFGEVRTSSPDLEPRARIVALAGEFRRVLRAHRGAVPILRSTPLHGPEARRGMVAALADFVELGFDPDLALAGCLALIDYVLGSVVFDSAVLVDRLTSDEVFAVGVEAFLHGLHAVADATREQ